MDVLKRPILSAEGATDLRHTTDAPSGRTSPRSTSLCHDPEIVQPTQVRTLRNGSCHRCVDGQEEPAIAGGVPGYNDLCSLDAVGVPVDP